MPITMRPTGLGSGTYKDDIDYSIFCGEWCIGRYLENRNRAGVFFQPKVNPLTRYLLCLFASTTDLSQYGALVGGVINLDGPSISA